MCVQPSLSIAYNWVVLANAPFLIRAFSFIRVPPMPWLWIIVSVRVSLNVYPAGRSTWTNLPDDDQHTNYKS